MPGEPVGSDGGHAATAAEVGDHEVAQVGPGGQHGLHGEPVEPVAAYALGAERIGDRQPARSLGQIGMEAGVEAGDVRGRRPSRPGSGQRVEGGRLVERRQRHRRLEVRHQLVVHDGGTVVLRTAVHDPVHDDAGPGRPVVRGLGEGVDGGVPGVGDVPRIVVVDGEGRVRRPDPLGQDPDDRLGVDGVADGSLERGGSGVEGQHPHPGHAQSRTSGMSSRCSRTYVAWRSSWERHRASSSAPPSGIRRERLNASSTRW